MSGWLVYHSNLQKQQVQHLHHRHRHHHRLCLVYLPHHHHLLEHLRLHLDHHHLLHTPPNPRTRLTKAYPYTAEHPGKL